MPREFSIVVFGATGYTGKLVCEELVEHCADESNVTWAVAGRSDTKLEKVLANISDETGLEFVKHIPIIVADVENPDTLLSMAKRAEIVINCVGPYNFYGEDVVLACIEGGAHHLDVSGEPTFLESMQLEYNTKAHEKKIYVIGSLGFDSLPAEVAVQYTIQQFPGDISEITTFMKLNTKKSNLNFGTFESAVNSICRAGETKEIRKKLFPGSSPPTPYKLASRGWLFYEPTVSSWCIPFLGTDRSVVYRSQRSLHESKVTENFVQFRPYLCVASFMKGLMTLLFLCFFSMMCQFKVTRNFMLKNYSLFTMGWVTKDTEKEDQGNSFTSTSIGRGYEKKSNDAPPHTGEPTKKIITRFSGPGCYKLTAVCVTQAALTLLEEKDKFPETGGVFPPAVAYWKTSLLQRLGKQGIHLEMLDETTSEKEEKKKD